MNRLFRLLLLGLLLALAGCSVPSRPTGSLFPRPGVATQVAAPAGTAATAGPAGTATATVSAAPPSPAHPSATPASATAAASAAASPPAAVADAIKATIQRANDEQQRAFAAHDPTLMRDTATGDYYDQLVQTNRDLENGGVTAIQLVALEWGPITLQGATGAQATTIETWRTTFSD